MIDIRKLESLAYEFRKALELVVDEGLYGRLTNFRYFPRECCRYTSDLMAEYLMSKGIPKRNIKMIECKTIKEGYTHCWLLVNDAFYVDISADQFNGQAYFKKYEPIPNCCVVPCKTNYFYECFDSREMHYIDNVGINSYGGDVPMKLQVIYDAVVQKIERNTEVK